MKSDETAMACTTMDGSWGWEFFFKYKWMGPGGGNSFLNIKGKVAWVLWKGVVAIGAGPAAAMAIVNMAFDSHGSCWPSTNSHAPKLCSLSPSLATHAKI
jgi:hypothetical protein